MAVTKVYKETDGFNLMLVEGSTFIAEIGYPGLRFQEVDGVANVVVEDLVKESNYFIPIADVRDSANAAIGSNTEAEVRTHIDAEMAK